MADMKLSKSDKKKENTLVAMGSNDYPWGLVINLDESALKKLGISELPDAGDEVQIKAVGKASRVSSTTSEGKKLRSLEIQITKMGISCDEKEEKAMKSAIKAHGYRK